METTVKITVDSLQVESVLVIVEQLADNIKRDVAQARVKLHNLDKAAEKDNEQQA